MLLAVSGLSCGLNLRVELADVLLGLRSYFEETAFLFAEAAGEEWAFLPASEVLHTCNAEEVVSAGGALYKLWGRLLVIAYTAAKINLHFYNS